MRIRENSSFNILDKIQFVTHVLNDLSTILSVVIPPTVEFKECQQITSQLVV